MLIDAFNHTIDTWIKALELYNFNQLCAKPSPKSWSIGQVYMHLADDTNYYIEQIKICVSGSDNEMEEAWPAAKTMFRNNDFPDEIIEGSPAHAGIPQPASKEQLLHALMNIKDEMNKLQLLIPKSSSGGKTKHPGFNYFNAYEWLRFAEMHFRHHMRQKKRIDGFLKKEAASG